MSRKKIHPIWWLVGGVIAVSTATAIAPRLSYPPGSVERLAIKDQNLKIVSRYTDTLARLEQMCTEDKSTIIAMATEVAETRMKADKETDYLDALVKMSNVVGVGYYKPPNNCTQVYNQMMKNSIQVHY